MLAVYGKHKTEEKFKGFNFKTGTFEVNKINVTVFSDEIEVKNRLQKEVDYMNEKNKEYIFKIRKI